MALGGHGAVSFGLLRSGLLLHDARLRYVFEAPFALGWFAQDKLALIKADNLQRRDFWDRICGLGAASVCAHWKVRAIKPPPPSPFPLPERKTPTTPTVIARRQADAANRRCPKDNPELALTHSGLPRPKKEGLAIKN